MIRKDSKIINWFNNIKAVHRLLFSLTTAIICSLILFTAKIELITSIMIGWDAFSIFMIIISWITFFTTHAKQLCLQAATQDESRSIIFIIVLVSVCFSLVGTLLLLKSTNESLVQKELYTVVSLLGVALSRVLLHTIFTLRYTHLYYTHSLTNPKIHIEGLDFPEEKNPDYLDMAYFSFVIGMSFQVSDISITSKNIRRVALLHGLISFVFNTIIVALTINTIAGMNK